MSVPVMDPVTENEVISSVLNENEEPWQIIILDDDVNTQDYVTAVFIKHFGLDLSAAIKKMLEVHEEGRSVLDSGKRADMEFHHLAMGTYKLRSTVEKAS